MLGSEHCGTVCDAGLAVGGRRVSFVPVAFVWPFSGEGGG